MKRKHDDLELEFLFKELNENPYRRLNFSFFLISVIPILALVYAFSDIISKGIKAYNYTVCILALAGVILILGYIFAYGVIRNIVNKTLVYAAKAKRADEMKSAFAMALAHDLKSPLAAIKANISNLKAGFLGKLSKEQEDIVDICKETSTRMNAIIMELIDTYMIEARIAPLKVAPFDLKELVEEQKRELASVALNKNITIHLEFPQKAIILNADREKIYRAINNLFNNSIKHSHAGGKVTIKGSSVDHLICLEIFSDGPVIPEDRLQKIFDKFERVDKSVEGHGLGLSIAKDIIEFHGGKIGATSKPGAPNCFTVLLTSEKERFPWKAKQ